MKKIFAIAILIICTLTFSVVAKTNDTNVRINYLDNVYGNFKIGELFYWNQIGLTYANEKLAYCIEPGKWIDESTYDSFTDFSIKNLNDQKKHQLELYAYYGYQYRGHQTTNYYLATQELIWRYLGISEMYWSTGSVHSGDRINVEKEKNVINQLISKHNDLPSFHNQTIEAISGHEINLDDTNNVFEKFELVYPNNHAVSQGGNSLTIYPKKVGEDIIKFIKYSNDYKPSFIYTKNDSQAIVTLGLSNKIYTQVNVKVKGYKLNLHKKDRLTNSNVLSGEGSLKGATYILTNNLDFEEEIVTDDNGNGILENIPADNYILKETKASLGYQLDKNKYPITIGEDTSLEINMDVYEDVISNEVELIKVFSSGETGLVSPEIDVTFAIYDKDNNFVKEVTTNNFGRVKTTLNYGTYTIRQVNTLPNYERVDDFIIFVDENNGKPYEYILSDTLIDSRIKINKVDEDNIPIKQAGIKFKIKNIDTNQYIEQKLVYPEEIIIDTFETDKNGIIVTPYPIASGNYQLEEIKAPAGYLLNPNPIPFQINENSNFDNDEYGKIFNINVINKKPLAKVTINKSGEENWWHIDSNGNYYMTEDLKPLSGVEFDLISDEDIISNDNIVYPKNTVVEKLVTHSGVATSTLLPLGKYCIVETKSLPGYQFDNNKSCFELKYSNDKTEIIEQKFNIINKKIENNVEILKLGEKMINIIDNKGINNFEPLKGVKIGLFANENINLENKIINKDELIIENITDEDGKILLKNLPVGNYYIKEIKSEDSYQINDQKYNFVINDSLENSKKIIIKNYFKKSNIIIKKIDYDTKKALSGAVFSLKSSRLKDNMKFTTDQNGLISLKDISYGTYKLSELSAPIGYKKLNHNKTIKIDENNKTVELEISNIKYSMPNTSTDTKIKIYFIGACGIIGIIGFIITRISRKKML